MARPIIHSESMVTSEAASLQDLIETAPARGALRCSVVVPVYRGGKNFEACVASVASALREHDEFIVVADGEGDGSWRYAEKFGAHVLKLATNGGPSRARNAGAKAASGEILFFVDADVTIRPDCIERVEAVFQQEKDVAALIGSYDRDPAERAFVSRFKNLFHHYVHQRGSPEASTFWGACGAIRREVFLSCGGFDETYARPSIEDIELGYRLKAASHKIRLVPGIQVTHLKKWDPYTLVKTDLFDRAAPWTELILNQLVRRKASVGSDLNLGVAFRLSIITSFLMVAALIGAPFSPWTLLAIPPLAGFFVYLNFPLFWFFRKRCGRKFFVKSIFWRFCYDIYSGLGFLYGTSRFAQGAAVKLLSHAFAKLDAVALGAGVGMAAGLMLSSATAWLVAKGGASVGPILGLLSHFFPGYSVTSPGSLIGFFYGFVSGFLLGFSISWICNTVIRFYLAWMKMKAFFERRAGRNPT